MTGRAGPSVGNIDLLRQVCSGNMRSTSTSSSSISKGRSNDRSSDCDVVDGAMIGFSVKKIWCYGCLSSSVDGHGHGCFRWE